MPEKSEDTTNMSDITKEIEFYESIREEAVQKNDADKLSFAENKLEELRSGKVTSEFDLPEVSRTPFEFITKFNFDEYAKLEGNTMNSIVQTLLNMKEATVQELVSAQYEAKIQAITVGFEEERTNWEYQNRKLQSDLQAMGESNLLITTEKNEYKNKAEDFESRFKAIELKYNEDIAEKDAEIERRKAHEADLHDQIARAPAPTARPIIDIAVGSTDLDELIRKAKEQRDAETARIEEERKAALIKVTNIRWEDPNNRTFYNAELVIDSEAGKAGETIRFHYFKKGQYLEVTADDAARFRAEQIAEQGNTNSTEVVVENNPLVIPVAQTVQDFRAEGVNTEQANVSEPTNGPVCGEVAQEAPVTWEAIEARLTAFKQEVIKEIMIGEVA